MVCCKVPLASATLRKSYLETVAVLGSVLTCDWHWQHRAKLKSPAFILWLEPITDGTGNTMQTVLRLDVTMQ